MGGVLSLQPTCEQTVINASQCLCAEYSYIYNTSGNLESLTDAIKKLDANRLDVELSLDSQDSTGRERRTFEVDLWLKKASRIVGEYNVLKSSDTVELQRLCLCGFCSKNLKQSYCYGKSVVKLLKEVKDHDYKINNPMTVPAPIPEAEELRLPDIIEGQETLLKKVWDDLMKNEVRILGLYGMGGVGKTTLLKQINNKFAKTGGKFNIVIWVDVSKNATIHKIQEDIANRLEYQGEVWDGKTTSYRARALNTILNKKKFLLLFDDIWEPLDLEAVGIPDPDTKNGCKIAFTTRSKEVCGSMGVDPMEIHCLDFDNAWNLFQKRVGVKTLDSHPEIPELAMKVTRICDGLPLALNAIGKTMACKDTIRDWRHAIKILTSPATEFSDTKKKIFPILKYSYDKLSNNLLRSCFLYCSLFPRDYLIDKEKLIDYWICEKLIDEDKGREEALDQGHGILNTLIRASLLEETSKDHWAVSMHDVFREMALWITSDRVENEDQFFVQNGVMLREIPKEKNWRIATRVSLMKSEIKEIVDGPQCPRLTTLLLQDNCSLWNISGDFFRYMPELLVLDLSNNQDLHELPEEILRLAFLRYLDLSYTKIKRLPLDVQELKSLIHLNLEHTRMLKSLNRVSKFSSLRIFRLLDSNVMLDMKLMEELEMLKDLEFVSINISPSMTQEQWFHDSKVGKCIQEVCIKELPSESVEILVFPAAMSNLHDVYIESCKMLEITIEKTMWNRSVTNPYFSSLTYVSIRDCNNLKDLTWLMFASRLTHLFVSYSSQLEAIISEEKATSDLEAIISEEKATSVSEEERCNDSPFRNLEYLYLYSLPKLKSIYWTFLRFPCLKQMSINSCDNLTKLPLDSTSVFKVEEFVGKYDDEKWINSVEWKDEDTKLRFLPYFQHYEDQNPGNRFRRRQRVVLNP